jgi:hypothetical protein
MTLSFFARHAALLRAGTALLMAACSAGGGASSLGGRSNTGGGASIGVGGSQTGTGGGPSIGLGGGPSIQVDCANGTATTVSGTVYDPAGDLPLYNVVVYVPSKALDPVPEGVSCGRCDATASGGPIAAALSDASGNFVLNDVPAGANIPLVIQIGKWRRQVTIPNVTACTNTALTDPNLTRLPRNQSEGNIPQIAVTTGHSDALECLLRKIGIDEQEFSTDTGPGRVHMFVGCPNGSSGTGASMLSAALGGAAFPNATTLWSDMTKLMKYDMLVLSCEGTNSGACKDEKDANLPNIKAYADAGGKLFLDHMHFYWLNHNDDAWQSSADYVGVGTDLPATFGVKIDSSFPKGNAFADWLVTVKGSTTRGALTLLAGQFSVRQTFPPATQRWIYTDTNPGDSSGMGVEYMTMNTPVELAATTPDQQCGRVVYTDVHVEGGGSPDTSNAATPFPAGCVPNAALTAQEKALAFMLFDLSSCVIPETKTPEPPPVVPK